MLATHKFVFVHLPRTGGHFYPTLSGNSLHQLTKSAIICRASSLQRALPPAVLGAVRNPWAFYVSLYHYAWPQMPRSYSASWMSDNERLDFIGSIRNVVNLTANDKRLDALIEMLPERVDYSRRHIPNVTKDTIRAVRGTGVAHYTFRFNEMFGNANDVFLCRLETLKQDLVAFFERIGVASNELRDYCSVWTRRTVPSTLTTQPIIHRNSQELV